MTPETAKLVAQAQQFLSLGFTGANSRDPNCIALLNCVQDKGNAGRLSLLPSGLSFESEGGVLSVHTHDVLHVALQETSYGDVDVPVRIPKRATGEGNSELVRMQRLLVDCRDASRLSLSPASASLPDNVHVIAAFQSMSAAQVHCTSSAPHPPSLFHSAALGEGGGTGQAAGAAARQVQRGGRTG